MTWEIEQARRYRTSNDPESTITLYMGMKGRVPLGELITYLLIHHPGVKPYEVELNFATAKWEEPATDRDKADWEARQLDGLRRHEAWERKTYAELHAKYGSKK